MKSFFNRPALEAIQKEGLDLGARKNHDYGAAGDGIAMAGVRGVVTRMLDKQLRLLSLTEPGHEAAVKDESLRDTFVDMMNYATYAIALLDGTWGVGSPQIRFGSLVRFKPGTTYSRDNIYKVEEGELEGGVYVRLAFGPAVGTVESPQRIKTRLADLELAK